MCVARQISGTKRAHVTQNRGYFGGLIKQILKLARVVLTDRLDGHNQRLGRSQRHHEVTSNIGPGSRAATADRLNCNAILGGAASIRCVRGADRRRPEPSMHADSSIVRRALRHRGSAAA